MLRVSDPSTYSAKQFEFDMMQEVSSLGVPMCQPQELYLCDEGVHFIQSWVHGQDADQVIGNLPSQRQYALGLDAGRILRKIHSIKVPETCEDWAALYNRKLDKKIKNYLACPLKYENGQAYIDYINANRHLLKARPQSYHHGDFHNGNFMVDREDRLCIIDFGRNDYGDPWEDLKSITWDVELCPLFAKGIVNGYFENQVPIEFWRLLTLYIFSSILTSLPWAIPFGEEEIRVMQAKAQQTLKWYGDLENPIPNWYKIAGSVCQP